MNATQAIQKLRQVIRRQHKAFATEETYVLWLRRYMSAVHQMPNTLASEKKLERFLTELAHQDVAASTQQQCDRIAEQLNNRPRLRLGFKTPNEVYY